MLSLGRTSSAWTWDKAWLNTLMQAGPNHLPLKPGVFFWILLHIPKGLERVNSSSQHSLASLRTNKAAICSCFYFSEINWEKKLGHGLDLISWWRQVLSKMMQVFPLCHLFQEAVQRLPALRLISEGQQGSEHTSGVCTYTATTMYSLFFGFWGGYDSTWRRYSSVYLTIRNAL